MSDLNNFQELKLHENSESDDEEYDITTSRLEKLLSGDLIERGAKTKVKTTDSTIPKRPNVERPIRPRPDTQKVVYILNNLNNQQLFNGSQVRYDQTTGTIYPMNNNNNNIATPLPANMLQQTSTHPIEEIKRNLQSSAYTLHQNDLQNYNYSQVNSPDNYHNVPQNQNNSSINAVLNTSHDILYNSLSPESQMTSFPNTPGFIHDSLDYIFDETPDILHDVNINYNNNNNNNNNNNDYSRQPMTINEQKYFQQQCSSIPDERDICAAEISLLPNLDSIIKLKKERGET
jgi:hypothetical protein